MNTVTRRSVSKRPGASLNHRTPAAAINASLQLVMNSASTSEAGHSIPSSAARWAGSAASRYIHHRRGGVSRSVAVRIVLGGHRTEGVEGGIRRKKPKLAPT